MMRDTSLVSWAYWPQGGPVVHGKMPRKDMQKTLQKFEGEAQKVLAETGADHVVYGRKFYNEDGELEEIRFYLFPMTDTEFEKRVIPMKNQQVYAIHKKEGGVGMSDSLRASVVFRKALNQYGADSQVFMVMEEMSELQKELCKNHRCADNVSSIAEEIADVEIMLEQMKILFAVGPLVEEVKAAKIRRLADRLAGRPESEQKEATHGTHRKPL